MRDSGAAETRSVPAPLIDVENTIREDDGFFGFKSHFGYLEYQIRRYGTAIQQRMDLTFEWDDRKAALNYRKHGIRFEEAAMVFDDPLAASSQDRIEGGERRWQTIGTVAGALLLLVAHTVREANDGTEVVRTIRARRATRQEKKRYEHG